MKVTATAREVISYRLLAGDVLITKDSETWDDIAIPCLVTESASDLICGYHLAIIRPDERKLFSRFLLRCLQADHIKQQFQVAASGITRFGLPKAVIGSSLIPIPPLKIQQIVCRVLDEALETIAALIAKKQRLIELLDEKRAALISRAVTQGLDPNVPMKDSGVEWLGRVPLAWDIKRLSQVAESIQTGPFGSQLHADDYIEGGVPVINPSDLADGSIHLEGAATVSHETSQQLRRHRLSEGDVVLARRGELGCCGVVTRIEENWLCGTGSARVRPARGKLLGHFLKFVISIRGCKEQLELASVGATMDNLNARSIGRLVIPIPPLPYQEAITTECLAIGSQINALINLTVAVIDLLREYRSALITAAVTGQLDIREHEKKMEALAS
ncbi:MAG: restriction endonuclease subunit S [Bryobacteraceae bacterium]